MATSSHALATLVLMLLALPDAAAFAANDAPRVHRLRGSSSNLGSSHSLRSAAAAVPTWLPSAAASLAIVVSSVVAPAPAALAAGADIATRSASEFSSTAGFEEFAEQGGKMKADPSCFFNQCKEPTEACFTNPACLKGITCLGNCRGEQLCATQCFARFGSEKLNGWLSCTLEEQECVTTGVKQNTQAFYANPPPVVNSFKPSDLDGKWYKVLGYNPKYDNYPCQTNTFTAAAGGALENDILFRVPKPDGSGSWQNNFKETLVSGKGRSGGANMVVEGKMFGLTFHEDWYLIGKGEGYRVVAYRGDTQQGPYDGAFVFTTDVDALEASSWPRLRGEIDASMRNAKLDPTQLARIDNTCPADATSAGVSAAEASKEKLEWKDVFELTEWFRPGTIKKQAGFDPTKM